jgi:hypothetical protein
MKFLLAVLTTAMLALLGLQVRSSVIHPKLPTWEYKIESLDDVGSCYANDPTAMPKEPELAKQGSLGKFDWEAKAIRKAGTDWAASIVTACLNRMGNDRWELVYMDAEHLTFKRLKP